MGDNCCLTVTENETKNYGVEKPTQTCKNLNLLIKEKGIEHQIARAGQNYDLGNGASLKILFPSKPLIENRIKMSKSKGYKEGRICRHPGCKTRLSIYNSTDYCTKHKPGPLNEERKNLLREVRKKRRIKHGK